MFGIGACHFPKFCVLVSRLISPPTGGYFSIFFPGILVPLGWALLLCVVMSTLLPSSVPSFGLGTAEAVSLYFSPAAESWYFLWPFFLVTSSVFFFDCCCQYFLSFFASCARSKSCWVAFFSFLSFFASSSLRKWSKYCKYILPNLTWPSLLEVE